MGNFEIATQKLGLGENNSISCDVCNEAHLLEDLTKVETNLTGEYYSYVLEYKCPISGKVILGANA